MMWIRSVTRHLRRHDAPRIQQELAAQGDRHACKRIGRLMPAERIQGVCARRFVPRTTESQHPHPIAPNRLAKPPAPTGPNETWVAEMTNVWTADVWLYVAVLLDLWSRRVVCWATAETLRTRLRTNPCRWPCDIADPLTACCITAISAHNPYNNAAMESFNATCKLEFVGLAKDCGGYAARAETTLNFFYCVEKCYNRVRRHSALGYQFTMDFELQPN